MSAPGAADPGGTSASGATSSAEAISASETTSAPEASSASETTSGPEATSAPETTSASEIASTPESASAPERRREKLARLRDAGMLDEARRVRLFPLVVREVDDGHLITRKDTGSTVATGEPGARAVRLLRRGASLPRIRRILARRYGCAPDEVDVAPLLESLASADFIRDIDGHRITTTPDPARTLARQVLTTYVWPPLLLAAIRWLPLRLVLAGAHRAWGRGGGEGREDVADAMRAAGVGEASSVREHVRLLRRAQLDRMLLAALPPRRAVRWLLSIDDEGLERLERSVVQRPEDAPGPEPGRPADACATPAAPSPCGTLLCGYHLGSFSLVPFVLASRGWRVSMLTGDLEGSNASITRRIDELRAAGLAGTIETESGPMALRRLAGRLEDGALVLLFTDAGLAEGRRSGEDRRSGEGRRSVEIPLLGRRVRVPGGVGWLAERTGARVLPVAALPMRGGRHRVAVGPELEGRRAADVTAAAWARLEALVRAHPTAWWRWKDLGAAPLSAEAEPRRAPAATPRSAPSPG